MAKNPKPYRRFRARGKNTDDDGMEALRRLTAKQREGSGEPRQQKPPRSPRTPHPSRRQAGAGLPSPDTKADKERRRALERAGRPWWSFRGLGAWAIVRRIAVVAVVGLLVWMGIGLFVLNNAVKDSNNRIQRGVPPLLAAQPKGMLSSPTNLLVIGTDARPGEHNPRADTIMVIRLEPSSGRIKYLSIPRDFRVYQNPRLGHIKITESLHHGGQAGVVRAVRRLTGLPIHHIMVVNFRGFPRLVDDLGGITVYNPTNLSNCPYPGGRRVSFPQGHLKLDGADALVFSRVRYCDDDFHRAARQQAVMSAIQKEALSPLRFWEAPWNGAAVVRSMTTDMGITDIAKLGWLQLRLTQHPEDRIVLAGEPQTIGNVSYVIGLPDQNLEQIQRFVGRR